MADQSKQRVNDWPITVQRRRFQHEQRVTRANDLARALHSDTRREVIALRDGACGGYQINPVIEDENGE